MTTLAFGVPKTQSARGKRAARSATRRSLVQPSNSITASRSAEVATVANASMGGKREATSRKVGYGAWASGIVVT